MTDHLEDEAAPVEGRRGWQEDVQKRVSGLKQVRLPVADLEQNMSLFLELVSRLFRQMDRQMGADAAMKLDEVELAVEISAEGEVKLIAGGKAAGKGAIRLKFKRVDSE